jgi:hypothetical protein
MDIGGLHRHHGGSRCVSLSQTLASVPEGCYCGILLQHGVHGRTQTAGRGRRDWCLVRSGCRRMHNT